MKSGDEMQDILEGNIAVKAAIQAGHRVIEQLLAACLHTVMNAPIKVWMPM